MVQAPILSLPRRERYRTLPGALLIFCFITAWVGFWVIWDDLVPGEEPIPPGTVIQVSPTVSYVPADGWAIARSRTTPGSVSTVTREATAFQVQVSTWTQSLAGKVEEQKRIMRANGQRLIGADQSFHTGAGLTGVQFLYAGEQGEGIVWMSLDEASETVVTMQANGPSGGLRSQLPQVRQMVESVTLKGGS